MLYNNVWPQYNIVIVGTLMNTLALLVACRLAAVTYTAATCFLDGHVTRVEIGKDALQYDSSPKASQLGYPCGVMSVGGCMIPASERVPFVGKRAGSRCSLASLNSGKEDC